MIIIQCFIITNIRLNTSGLADLSPLGSQMCLVLLQAKRSLVELVLILFSSVNCTITVKVPFAMCTWHKLCVVFVICLRVIHKVVQLVIVNTKSVAVILCSKSTAYMFLLQTSTSFIVNKDHFLAFRHCTKYCFVS